MTLGGQASFTMSKVKSKLKNFRWDSGQSDGGVDHLSTFDLEVRNVTYALISLMGFPAILSTLQPFQICIYKRKYSKLTFSNGSQLMGKGLWQIYMHHWRVHAKVEFPRFPPDVRTGGVDLPVDLPIWALTVEISYYHSWLLDATTGGGSLPVDLPIWALTVEISYYHSWPLYATNGGVDLPIWALTVEMWNCHPDH